MVYNRWQDVLDSALPHGLHNQHRPSYQVHFSYFVQLLSLLTRHVQYRVFYLNDYGT